MFLWLFGRKHGVWDFSQVCVKTSRSSARALSLSLSLISLMPLQIFPQYMKDAGYETHMIGKWHIGSYTHDLLPSQRGFDTYLGYLNDEEMYWTHQVSRR